MRCIEKTPHPSPRLWRPTLSTRIALRGNRPESELRFRQRARWQSNAAFRSYVQEPFAGSVCYHCDLITRNLTASGSSFDQNKLHDFILSEGLAAIGSDAQGGAEALRRLCLQKR